MSCCKIQICTPIVSLDRIWNISAVALHRGCRLILQICNTQVLCVILFRPKGRRCISRYYVGSSEAHSKHGKEPENDVTYKSLHKYELSKPLKTWHSPQPIGSVGKSSDVDSDSNHGEHHLHRWHLFVLSIVPLCQGGDSQLQAREPHLLVWSNY